MPESPAPAHPRRSRAVALIVLVGVVAIGWRLGNWLTCREEKHSIELAQMKQQREGFKEQCAIIRGKWETLEKEHAQLVSSFAQIKQEKDRGEVENRATQEHLQSQQAVLSEERQHLLDQTQRLREENHQMDTRVKLLDQETASLRQANSKLVRERDAIQQAEKKAAVPRSQSEKTQGNLEKLENRLRQLQDENVRLASEKKRLQEQVKNVPKNVTRLAQQHERLLRDLATLHYNLAVMFSQQQQYRRAVKEFQKVIELRPDDPDAHYNLGVIYAEHLPDRGRAIAFFRKYLELNPHAQDAGWVKQYIATWQAWEGKERLD